VHSSCELGELSQCSKHDDSTIKIIAVIIIVVIINILLRRCELLNTAESEETKVVATDRQTDSKTEGLHAVHSAPVR